MSPRHYDRRELLRRLAALGAGGLIPVLARAQATSVCTTALLQDIDVQSIYALGNDYLNEHPNDAGVAEVRKLLEGNDSDDAIVERLRTAMHADFRRGSIVVLAGVFVSRTEGRIFAALNGCSL